MLCPMLMLSLSHKHLLTLTLDRDFSHIAIPYPIICARELILAMEWVEDETSVTDVPGRGPRRKVQVTVEHSTILHRWKLRARIVRRNYLTVRKEREGGESMHFGLYGVLMLAHTLYSEKIHSLMAGL